MKPAVSPYYPPRAGYTRYFFRFCDAVRFALQRTQLVSDVDLPIAPAGFLKDCLVPGFGFRLAGWELAARIALGCWVLAFFAYFAFIGRGTATFAFGVMMSIHATSIVCAVSRVWPQRLLVVRLLMAFTTALALYVALYGPALGVLQRSFIMPIWSNGGLYVINRTSWGQEIRRDDLIAYRLPAQSGMVRSQEGNGMDRVIGLPGDVVEFTPTTVRINGRTRLKQEGMPDGGTITVPQNCWFVWPTLRMVLHRGLPLSQIAEAKVALGTIRKGDILGKPVGFHLWRTKNQ